MNTKPYTFETFITTPSNRQARIAAEKVCAEPGTCYNPLVLCGAHGTGKTHLLHAVATSFLEKGLSVICVSAHQLVKDLVESIRNGDEKPFEETYQKADVVLIDDLHELANKDATQEFVQHLAENLIYQGKQVVVTVNDSYCENSAIRPSLREVLSRGLCVELNTPELVHIKMLCKQIADELGLIPTKKQIDLGELTQLRNATKINDPDRPGLICIGSRPGMGKTAFALDIVLDAAISNQKDILIFSLEMTAKQIAERLLRKLCGVNIREFRNSTRSEDDKAKLSAAIAFLQERNILIDDNFNTSPAYIEKCIQSCENPGVVLIDYLQLLHADEKEDAYQLEICKIIRSLLLQSQKYCVKMVVLTQIGRIFRKDKRPILDDIRSIGCLHQDSDVVLFVYRDEYYESDSANDAAEIIIAKNRYGECCTIHMCFDGLSVSFRENAAIESEIAKAE